MTPENDRLTNFRSDDGLRALVNMLLQFMIYIKQETAVKCKRQNQDKETDWNNVCK